MRRQFGKIGLFGTLAIVSSHCGVARRLNSGIRHSEAFRTMPGIVYERGFYPSESLREPSGEIHEIHWTGAVASAALPPWTGGAVLKFVVESPPERFKARPVVALTLNGTLLDRFVLTKFYNEKTYLIPGGVLRADATNSLVFGASQTFDEAPGGGGDPRILGLAVSGLRLEPPLAP
jgi:hypothetical protein